MILILRETEVASHGRTAPLFVQIKPTYPNHDIMGETAQGGASSENHPTASRLGKHP
jgi:hypothetical protein